MPPRKRPDNDGRYGSRRLSALSSSLSSLRRVSVTDSGDRVRIGVMFRCATPVEELPDFARRAEAAGFDEIWVVEDCFYSGGVAAAATALAATARVRVGVGILPAPVRNAAFTAMEFATLARVHPGRFIGGLGHGMPSWMAQVGATTPRRWPLWRKA
jgi:alkanesulfonate monooxygenase SsuD/methylene tetrahydromethanopterin reductase-like flavin-dependent oxidoreductase (luciferase family)